MYEILGASLTLAVLLSVNAIASVLAAFFWRMLATRATKWPAGTRARVTFALRSYPLIGSLLVILVLLAPAYYLYEPEHTNENVSVTLAALALFSSAGLALALWRGLASWYVTGRLVRRWHASARPVALQGIGLPVFVIEDKFPVMAVVGILRPRLYVANQILETLTPDELAAAIAHEHGHVRARDNFKRFVMRACRDSLMIFPTGRLLDVAWSESIEEAADEYAAQTHKGMAIELASALIKIARLAPSGGNAMINASAILPLTQAHAGLSRRIDKLLSFKGETSSTELLAGLATWGVCIGFASVLAIAVATTDILPYTHHLIEQLVAVLS
jgi:Zn-dependent protease with chaperone function